MQKNKKIPKRKVIKTSVYSIKRIEYDDGKYGIIRRCEGFNTFELLGILEDTQLDIIDQMRGKIPPAEFNKKQVVVEQ